MPVKINTISISVMRAIEPRQRIFCRGIFCEGGEIRKPKQDLYGPSHDLIRKIKEE